MKAGECFSEFHSTRANRHSTLKTLVTCFNSNSMQKIWSCYKTFDSFCLCKVMCYWLKWFLAALCFGKNMKVMPNPNNPNIYSQINIYNLWKRTDFLLTILYMPMAQNEYITPNFRRVNNLQLKQTCLGPMFDYHLAQLGHNK